MFVRDRWTGTTRRVSISSAGNQASGDSSALFYQDGRLLGFDTPSISVRGRFVAFSSLATNLVRFDTNGLDDLFVRGPRNP